MKRQVLEVMRVTGLDNVTGEQHIFANVDMAIDAIYDWLGQGAAGKYCPLKRQLVSI